MINRAESGEIKPEMVGKLGYLANTLAKMIESSDLEKRMERMEARFKDQAGRKDGGKSVGVLG